MDLKVLTVDDSKTIRMIVKKAFKPYACQIFEAENGVEGLAAAAKEKPDLIVLDITMPVMSGIEMLERLKAEKEMKDIPVIMLTAESGRDNVMQVVKMGVTDYMVKPFKGQDLIERVQKVVDLEGCAERTETCRPADQYFSQVDDIFVLTLPAKVTRPVVVEVEGNLKSRVGKEATAGVQNMILDLRQVSETNVSLIKLIIATLQQCQQSRVAVKVVGNPRQVEELKGFQETSEIPVAGSIQEAAAHF